MSVTLFEMAHSPYCIPIAQALTALGVDFTRREIPNWDRRELLRLTNGAYYAVPVLQHGGHVIYESGADTLDVARYVDRTFAAGALFPAHLEGLQAIVVEFIENEVEARTFKLVDIHWLPTVPDIGERGMVVRHKERKFGRGCVGQWRANAANLRAEADGLLARFEITLQHSHFLFGDVPVYADFALYGILGNLTFRGYNDFNSAQIALRKWFDVMRAFRFPRGEVTPK